MHKKQKVTRRKYFVRNKLQTASDSSSSALGGIKSLSKLSGSSRLLNAAAFLIISLTSEIRPLHKSHLGDSGTTNLQKKKTTKKINWI